MCNKRARTSRITTATDIAVPDQRFSAEFYPPATESASAKLPAVGERLKTLEPEFFSVTFGAGGSEQNRTLDTVRLLNSRSGIDTAPHITCIGSSKNRISALLDDYRAQGIRRLVVLRGDLPSGSRSAGEFNYAVELVQFIRQYSNDYFTVHVACYPEVHPEAHSPDSDVQHFADKVKAGADGAITQYFYNADAYLNFRDRCAAEGVDVPIVPGIMPITNYKGLVRFSDQCGADIPRWIRLRLQEYRDDPDSLKAFGTEVVTRLCQRLLDQGAPGLHFYCMNRASPVLRIWENLSTSGH